MNLTEKPETLEWPETEYVFVERVGPFQFNAPQAWGEAHKLVEALMKHNTITGYLSLYKVVEKVYRAGFALDAAPRELPAGLRYEKFKGGKYSRFVLTGSYSQLGPATGRVFEIVAEKGIRQRDDFCIEYYVNDPRVTAEENLITEILVPTV
jgi:DNA gyrase inhibitor GyrI